MATARPHDGRSPRERGEGVISTGIAVLIMALIGASLWFAFSRTMGSTANEIDEEVSCVTSNTCTDNTGEIGTGEGTGN